MTKPPTNPKIYHITHVENLCGIIRTGKLWSDAKRVKLQLNCAVVGMSEIKQRRLATLPVKCNPGTNVGEYVPFYFCPRSIMLYLLYMSNHRDLSYRGGQRPIVHLRADLKKTIVWAEANEVRWAFSDCNAGGRLAEFFKSPDDLDKINWNAVENPDFRDPLVKEGKQAEFLIYESFPWELVEEVGVLDGEIEQQVEKTLQHAAHKPIVKVEKAWYYGT